MEIDVDRVVDTLWERITFPVIGLLFVFMTAIRLMPMDRVFTDKGVVYSGNDGWYHMRIVRVITQEFPAAPGFDVWSRFPFGTGNHSGFGGLFDQLIAFAAILVGGGSPSPELVDATGAVAPAVFGAATVIPAYYVAKSISGRGTGMVAAGLLALASGQFLSRTVVGSPDHQSAEALFGTLAVAGFVAAVLAAYRHKPTTAHLRDHDIQGIKEFLTIAVLGGVAIASYLMLWPPGVMLIFTFGVFAVLQIVRDHLRNEPTDYTAFGVAAPLLVASVLTALYAKDMGLSSTDFSLLQPLVTGGVAAGAAYLHALSTAFENRDLDPKSYPVAVVGTIAGSLLAMALIYPPGIGMLRSLIVRVYSFGLLTSQTALTVAEISPASPVQAWSSFGFLFLLAFAGMALIVYRVVLENRPIELLVLLWSLTMFSAYFTMIRFGYYVAVNVAVLSAFTLGWFVKDIMDIDFSQGSLEDIKGYEVLSVVILLMLVLPGNVVAVAGTSPPVWDTAPNLSGANDEWLEELDWVRENTPEIPLEYSEQYERPEDGDFDYPVDDSPLKGAYGVMSWWDYGHWITTRGHRIPVANPFQENQIPASDFLTSRSEERANLVLDALPSIPVRENNIDEIGDDELRDIIAEQSAQERHEDTRYVMIDDQSAGGKFNAIATWTDFSGYVTREPFQYNNQTQRLPATNDVYRDTTLSRLYFDDANGMATYRLVHENEQFSVVASILDLQAGQVQRINRRLMTRDYDEPFQPGGELMMRDLSVLPDEQTIPVGGNRQLLYDIKAAASVKTFERVPGATITGDADVDGPANVTAVLELETTNTDRNFTYTRTAETDSAGAFSLDVSYPTDDALDPSDGATDASVESLADYQVYVGNVTVRQVLGQTAVVGNVSEVGTVEVPERAIYDGTEVSVELEERAREPAENRTLQIGS